MLFLPNLYISFSNLIKLLSSFYFTTIVCDLLETMTINILYFVEVWEDMMMNEWPNSIYLSLHRCFYLYCHLKQQLLLHQCIFSFAYEITFHTYCMYALSQHLFSVLTRVSYLHLSICLVPGSNFGTLKWMGMN